MVYELEQLNVSYFRFHELMLETYGMDKSSLLEFPLFCDG